MSKQITPFTISSPGFYGLNLQDSPIDLSPNFALQAINCVIDKSGRIAPRKGWLAVNTTNTDLGAATIQCIGELISNAGVSTLLAAGNNHLFTVGATTLTTLTYGGGGSAPTITASNWQFVQLNGLGMFWQRGHDTLIFEPSVSTTTYRRLSERSGASGSFFQCNTAIAAYGRVWAADTTTDKNTVVFSDALSPHVMTGGTSGTLNLLGVWAVGGDEIVAMAAHNNFLFIFGKKQTLVYSGAGTPSTMVLADAIVGVGCIARDSVQTTGNDVIFLSDVGITSIQRTIQEKSAPVFPLSKNVLEEIQSHVSAETLNNIKSAFSPVDGFYLLSMPTFSEVYCFDTTRPLPDGALRVTTWQNINPSCFCATKNRKLYLGKAGSVGLYTGYTDNLISYRMSYFTPWIDFGNPIQTSILKKIILTVISGINQPVIFKWGYDFNQNYFTQTVSITGLNATAEFGVSEYNLIAEYSGNLSVSTISASGTSCGKVIQFGFETEIQGTPISIQKIELYTKDGRL